MHSPTVPRPLVDVVQDALIAILGGQDEEHNVLGSCVLVHPILIVQVPHETWLIKFNLWEREGAEGLYVPYEKKLKERNGSPRGVGIFLLNMLHAGLPLVTHFLQRLQISS